MAVVTAESKKQIPMTRNVELVLPALMRLPPEKPVTVIASPHNPNTTCTVEKGSQLCEKNAF